MTKEDLIKAIQVKMDSLNITNTSEDPYMDAYYTFINECLSLIANTILPYQQKIEVFYGGRTNTTVGLDTTKYYRLSEDIPNLGFKNDWIEYEDTSWVKIPNNKFGYIIDIPKGLLSFSKEALPKYTSLRGDVELNADVLYLNPKQLALPKDGNYEIWYNSEYPTISATDNIDDLEDFIPKNVLNTIPSYVASQCLMSEDLQRAAILRNEFETLLARVDDNKPLAEYVINNKDGWTD